MFQCHNFLFQATGSKIGVTLEALTTISVALGISFYYSWKLTLVTLGFMPFMIATGIVHSKILTGFARGDKNSLDQAGKVRIVIMMIF